MATKKAKPVKAKTELPSKEPVKKEKIISSTPTQKRELTERQKFQKFFIDEYLLDANESMDNPHHPDKHGVLGYENNNPSEWDIMTGKNLEPVKVDLVGFCANCSPSKESAKEAYDKKNG
jgi:hypothetical protein